MPYRNEFEHISICLTHTQGLSIECYTDTGGIFSELKAGSIFYGKNALGPKKTCCAACQNTPTPYDMQPVSEKFSVSIYMACPIPIRINKMLESTLSNGFSSGHINAFPA